MLRTRNNTDGNKLVIFSGIALYYGDTYIILALMQVSEIHVQQAAIKKVTRLLPSLVEWGVAM